MAHKLVFNALTRESVKHELTEAEAEQRKKDIAEHAKLVQAELDRVAARQTVLDKLGLTADEAAALFGQI